ncbi:MAG: peptidoglycan editing factor PgeF [Candidatus Doudnabacteria bacterium CG10_big_fil_rev_8_21_14_0_10_41_10]|uniref:Purine nucleoside phosphorylase n=1 Tax=Candidatus Doudnabacteria bacterium CG10_big_fil_rev_8_21_14_0_10_41_10 TaxID=1974551 RepID=A0A2H0VEA9_9BACT|nr:MAG: peptidoglycan editing factor PgeF [Candidatus Doudnabacteria bacterium CG10_big_fil_rev_8_21_14_0_10_41_10]
MILEDFSEYPEIIIGVSEKPDGNMKLGARESKNNRERFFSNKKIPFTSVVSAGLVHGARVKIVGKKNRGKIVKGTDGLATKDRGTILTVTVADCIPIYFYDQEKQVVAIAHGGWKGILAGIVLNTLTALEDNFKVNPKMLRVLLGPGIQRCHYEIQNNVAEKFKMYPKALFLKEKHYLDLFKVIRLQLVEKGLREENISVSGQCTYEDETRFFSYRRDKPKTVQAMVAFIGFRN